MAKKATSSTASGKSLPGLSLEKFQAGVEAMTSLSKTGEFLVFVSRPFFVHFVGKTDLFYSAFAAATKDEGSSEKESRQAMDEVKNFLQLYLAMETETEALRYLKNHVMKNSFDAWGDESSGLASFLAQKLKLVEPLKASMSRRVKRLKTAVGPCPRDVDIEVVSQRHDNAGDAVVSQPFLRVRLRYSAASDDSTFPFFWSAWGPPPFPNMPSRAFEFECDESDIDLMILRLIDAKNALLSSLQGPSDFPGTKERQ